MRATRGVQKEEPLRKRLRNGSPQNGKRRMHHNPTDLAIKRQAANSGTRIALPEYVPPTYADWRVLPYAADCHKLPLLFLNDATLAVLLQTAACRRWCGCQQCRAWHVEHAHKRLAGCFLASGVDGNGYAHSAIYYAIVPKKSGLAVAHRIRVRNGLFVRVCQPGEQFAFFSTADFARVRQVAASRGDLRQVAACPISTRVLSPIDACHKLYHAINRIPCDRDSPWGKGEGVDLLSCSKKWSKAEVKRASGEKGHGENSQTGFRLLRDVNLGMTDYGVHFLDECHDGITFVSMSHVDYESEDGPGGRVNRYYRIDNLGIMEVIRQRAFWGMPGSVRAVPEEFAEFGAVHGLYEDAIERERAERERAEREQAESDRRKCQENDCSDGGNLLF
jgi:hypothetical protein